MGMYDTVYVSSDVAAAWSLRCAKCQRAPKADVQWQTKAFEPCMHSYFLRYDEAGAIRLYLLDRPSARRFWREFSPEEIAESKRIGAERGGLFAAWEKKPGDGYFLPEAFLPEYRRQRFMGELPHQWAEIYHSCECSQFIDYWIKFSDGIALECRTKQPEHGQDFFNSASEFGL
jgi:hypothetical protein